MTQADLLRYVVDALEGIGIVYMIGGLRLERRQRLPLVPGREAYFARPEDIILYKLMYYAEGGSDLHLRDIAGILRVSGPELDLPYVGEWAARLGLGASWDAVAKRGLGT